MDSPPKGKPILGKDIPWKDVKQKICHVTHFSQLAKVEDGKVVAFDRATPYGFLTVECEDLPDEATIWVTHRIDFLHLWQAFKQRDESKGEEVLIIPLPNMWSWIFPMLRVWLCPKDSFKKMTHQMPTRPGEAGYLEVAPIAEWKEGLQRSE